MTKFWTEIVDGRLRDGVVIADQTYGHVWIKVTVPKSAAEDVRVSIHGDKEQPTYEGSISALNMAMEANPRKMLQIVLSDMVKRALWIPPVSCDEWHMMDSFAVNIWPQCYDWLGEECQRSYAGTPAHTL